MQLVFLKLITTQGMQSTRLDIPFSNTSTISTHNAGLEIENTTVFGKLEMIEVKVQSVPYGTANENQTDLAVDGSFGEGGLPAFRGRCVNRAGRDLGPRGPNTNAAEARQAQRGYKAPDSVSSRGRNYCC